MTATNAGEAFTELGSPSFQETEIDEGFVRISKLAVTSFLIACFSLFSLITVSLVPVCLLAVLLGVVALVRIHRDATLGGARFAQIAVVLGTLVGFWALTAAQQRAKYLYQVAGEHAKSYLQILAAGDTFQAMELRKLEPERQLAGTQLALVYGGEGSEAAQEMKQFLDRTTTKIVLESGPESDWRIVSGEGIEYKNKITNVTVRMDNVADPETTDIFVTLGRVGGVLNEEQEPAKALWYVVNEQLPGDRR